ncbi:phosphoenolpyruvate--protein phosphotransferase [Alkalilimnicola ehrlichii MLHE-1]|uniref:phosphoenolpyruvate--protein phosphotransferase n=1 Tax=Alkalilimnicola ehrlichii (strain ATCC BAA-1101 / DSM 17681 / MLHE-1) TaxID=187272 RepID=Q0ABK5_ALKEH|nr:phosphoenolpyruvate--protein phosphotransferase [Alkalilimnicola ehrlichii]ABI55782.1 PTSINtr with GAF domain, PtsP [Alkalilimnicola ehrlichii MLHE-1]
MLEVLHRISREVNAAPGLRQALSIIVKRVADAMKVDVCSVYLMDPETERLVLMDTRGLNPDAVGRVRLRLSEGLVGMVAERGEPINLDNAYDHPRFRYFPETGEELFHSFLGVPIVHYRKLLGVLVVQQMAERRFDEDDVAFLVTLGAQLAGAIAHAEASGGLDGLRDGDVAQGRMLQGLPAAPGVAMGTAVVHSAQVDLESVPDRDPEDIEEEKRQFMVAVRAVREELGRLSKELEGTLSSDEHMLFDVYLRMLDDDSLVGETLRAIEAGNWAPGALREIIGGHVQVFQDMEDPYLRERASDIRDLGSRILARLREDTRRSRPLPERVILVGKEVSATQLAEVPQDHLAGVVSASGTRNSHVAILARALSVPAIMGASDLSTGRLDGKPVIVDGYSGRFYVQPSDAVREEYERLARDEAEFADSLESLKDEPAETPDGYRIKLLANTGLISDINLSLASGCDGIGLHRTEFPFIVRDRFPGEEEQAMLYRRVLEYFRPRPVVLRTLDIGGDKSLPYFPVHEENPFLGWRGIRLTLDHPEIFLTQLRAMVRANIGNGNLRVMFPMISRLHEVDEAKALLARAVEELREEGMEVEMPPVGVMVEVPAAVAMADKLAQRVAFLSVGTNDLTQYLLAVDRNNARVAALYDELHPAVLNAIAQVVDSGRQYRCPVSVCGGMAGDPAGAILLLALGVSSLSMSVASLLRIKWVVRSISRERATELLTLALDMESPDDVRAMLKRALDEQGLGGLIRAGK